MVFGRTLEVLWGASLQYRGRASTPFFSAAFLSFALGSCSGVPEYNLPHSGVSVHYIINRIKCEVIKAADEHTQLRTDKWIAVANLTLQIDDEGSLAPNVAFINPLAAASTSFTFNAGANLTAHRQRIYSENFSLDIATLKEKPKTCAPHDNSPLTGDLGIGETVDLGLRSLKRGGPVDYNPQRMMLLARLYSLF